MDFDIASQASAIDDSFFPITPIPASAETQGDNVLDRAWVSGHRPGHWTISSTVNGSGIDDRTPTIFGLPAQSNNGSVASAKRIDGSVLRKLAAATEAARRVKADAFKKEEAENTGDDGLEQQARVKSAKEKKGFYVPRLDNRGIRMQARGGKSEVIRQPIPPPVALPDAPAKKDETKQPTADDARAKSRPASVKGVVTASNTNKRTSNRVRIVGKNGEESFVELPFIPRTSKSTPAARTPKDVPQVAPPVPAAAAGPIDDAKVKAKREAMAQKEANRLRDERLAAKATAEKEAEQLRNERLAAEAIMHGALPASSKASSAARSAKQSKSSGKASERQVPGVFDSASKPTSIASSTTSVTKTPGVQQPIQSQEDVRKVSKGRSKPSTIAGWQEVGLGSYEPAASNRDKPKQLKPTTQPEDRTATKKPSPPASGGAQSPDNLDKGLRHSSAPNSTTNQYLYRNPTNSQKASGDGTQYSAQFAQDNGDKRSRTSAESANSLPVEIPPLSNHSYPHLKQVSSGGFGPGVQGPTVFAGRGWISPHPLSEAPTWAREEPDPVIHLPSGAAIRTGSTVETMTYEEWLAVQNQPDSNTGSRAASSKIHTVVSSAKDRSGGRSEGSSVLAGRRNFSITESHASRQYAGGSWAWKEEVKERPSNYRTPTVRTEGASGSSQQHSLKRSSARDNVKAAEIQDEDGKAKVQLEMPWDKPPSRQASVSPSDAFFF